MSGVLAQVCGRERPASAGIEAPDQVQNLFLHGIAWKAEMPGSRHREWERKIRITKLCDQNGLPSAWPQIPPSVRDGTLVVLVLRDGHLLDSNSQRAHRLKNT